MGVGDVWCIWCHSNGRCTVQAIGVLALALPVQHIMMWLVGYNYVKGNLFPDSPGALPGTTSDDQVVPLLSHRLDLSPTQTLAPRMIPETDRLFVQFGVLPAELRCSLRHEMRSL